MTDIQIEKLSDKISQDWKSYREKQLERTKEELLQDSYKNALAGEAEFFLDNYLDQETDEDEDSGDAYDKVMKSDNIIDDMVEIAFSFDTFDFSIDGMREVWEQL